MKLSFFFFAAVLGIALAAPTDKEVGIVRSSFDLQPEGSYNFGFETENNIIREETGELKTVTNEEGKPESVVVVRGTFTYNDEAGNPITVNYVADETGFHPEGKHLPVARR